MMTPAPVSPLTLRETLSYAGGSVASNLSWNLVAGFLIVYYTDVALLPAAAVGTLILLTRIFDAVLDPAVGLLMDRTDTRFGKARPYVLFASVPFAVLAVLTFAVPEGSLTAKTVYAYVTFGLLGIAYSFLYVPYAALQPMMTAEPRSLLRLSGVRAAGTSVASILVYSFTIPCIAFFGNGNSRTGYVGTAMLFAALTTILYILVFVYCRERHVDIRKERPRLLRSLRALSRNKVWIIAMAFELLIFIRLGLLAPAMPFLAKEFFGRPALASVLLPSMSVAILVGGLLAPWYLSRLGKRRGMIIALLFTMSCFAALLLTGTNFKLFLALFFIGSISAGFQATMVFTMIAEAVTFQAKTSGSREEGLLSSSASLAQKVGFAVGSALLAYLLALTHYDPVHPQPGVRQSLLWLVAGAPVVIGAMQLVCIRFYDLEELPA